MSDSVVAVRAIALAEAVKSNSGNVIGTAQIYLDFLNGVGDTSAAKPVEKAAKPAKPTKAVKEVEPEPEVPPAGPSKADVGLAVEKMLGANKRTEAVNLMKKFGASSVSTLKDSDYAAFIEASDAILMTA